MRDMKTRNTTKEAKQATMTLRLKEVTKNAVYAEAMKEGTSMNTRVEEILLADKRIQDSIALQMKAGK